MASKLDFLATAKALAVLEPVEISGLNFEVFVRQISAADFRKISEDCTVPGKSAEDGKEAFDEEKLALHITAAAAVDKSGKRLIPKGRESELMDLPARIQTALQLAALKANGLDKGSQEKN